MKNDLTPLDHSFLILVVKKFDFGLDFINWIETLLNDQMSCLIKKEKTTRYFILLRDACQCNPVSAFWFILSVEIVLLSFEKSSEIQGFEIFDRCYLYSAYADDTTFFLKNENAIKWEKKEIKWET